MPKIEKDRSKVVQSSLWMIWDIYRPVSALILPKIGKILDWTRLSSTTFINQLLDRVSNQKETGEEGKNN